jgi:hypothetical protein
VTLYAADGTVAATTTADETTGAYSFTSNLLGDGETGTVTATDGAGNEGPSTEITAVDATAPAAPTVTTSNASELSGVAEAGSTVTLYAADGTVEATTTADGTTGAYSFTSNLLGDGETGTVTATDDAGNEGTATEITAVDATAPTVTAVTIPDSAMNVGDVVTATLTVSGAVGETLTLPSGSTIGGFALGSLSKVSDTQYTATFTVTEGGTDVAASADIPVSVSLADPAGNVSSTYTTAIIQASDEIDSGASSVDSSGQIDTTLDDGARHTTAADIDNDGDLDLITSSSTSDAFVVFMNDGTGGFDEGTQIDTTLDDGAYHTTAADIDNDGDLEIIGSANGSDSFSVFEVL